MPKTKTKSRTASQLGKYKREKGKAGERDAVKYLKSLCFEDAQRTVQYNGAGGVGDVVCPESLPHLHIEVKWHVEGMELGTVKFREALRQAEKDCPEDCEWVLLWKPKAAGANQWRLSLDNGATYADDGTIRAMLGILRRQSIPPHRALA